MGPLHLPPWDLSDELLSLTLGISSLLVVTQLLTMLGTRWGDRHALAKSFFVSLLIHLTLGLGWISATRHVDYAQLTTPIAPRKPEELPEPVPIKIYEEMVLSSESGMQNSTEDYRSIISKLRGTNLETSSQFIKDLSTPPMESQPPELKAMIIDNHHDSEKLPEQSPVYTPQLLQGMVEPELPTAHDSPQDEPHPFPLHTLSESPSTAPLIETGPIVLRPDQRSSLLLLKVDIPAGSVVGTAQRMAPTEQRVTERIPVEIHDESADIPLPTREGTVMQHPTAPLAIPLQRPDVGVPGLPTGRSPEPAVLRSIPSLSSMADPDYLTPSRITSQRKPQPHTMHEGLQPSSELLLPSPEHIAITANSRSASDISPLYAQRAAENRLQVAILHGGSAESEKAVERALAWLAQQQEANGSWDADRFGAGQREVRPIDPGKPGGGREIDAGITGLALLCFLGAGYTHNHEIYGDTVRRAINWLVSIQQENGALGYRATYYDHMYCHAIATYALAEAYGMQSQRTHWPTLQRALALALEYTCSSQNADGGWRYRGGMEESDMSISGWQMMALKSAELAGLPTPPDVKTKMLAFLKQRSRGDSLGLAGYKRTDPPTPAMTAEAWLCKQMYGLRREASSSQEAAGYLLKHLPRPSSPDEYYWYYGTLAMFHHGGEPWKRWNEALRDTLVLLQRKQGDLAGSWDPVGPYGTVGGRLYSTALCVLALEVYYRFLPLYRFEASPSSD